MGVIDFEDLLRHEGHEIVCVTYGDPPVNVAIECETCREVLLDFNREGDEDEDVHCKFCDRVCHAGDVRWHQKTPVCEDCWDDRLKTTE